MKITNPYCLRPHPLPVPKINHVYAESRLVFQLVKMHNNVKVNEELIWIKLEEKSHSHSGFSKYVKQTFVNKYSYTCENVPFRTCDRV